MGSVEERKVPTATLNYGTGRDIHNNGVHNLIKDFKFLLHEGNKNGDVTFLLKAEKTVKAHLLIVKARCKSYQGETNFDDVSLEVFQTFLKYVYTGKLRVESHQNYFPLYLLSLKFGLEDLSLLCEDLMISNLNLSSAISVLQEAIASLPVASEEENRASSTANNANSTNPVPKSTSSNNRIISANKKPSGSNTPSKHENEWIIKVQRLIDTCITFISENSPSVLKKNLNFLNSSVETISYILDSEHLCIEEEEVWRCVLAWAQHKAGVVHTVGLWTEDDKAKVSKFLTPVISHVKLLLIDSRVFAEEVEPTGCVSMAISLERYRCAALSSQFDRLDVAGSDRRLTPRTAQKLFHSSFIISNERGLLGKKLQEWYLAQNPDSTSTNWKCIFRASQHGFAAEDFHSKVDGHAPTYVVVLLKNNKWVCGGYTDVPWSSSKSSKFVSSSKTFLFAMNPSTNDVPIQFPVVKKHFATCHEASSGPIFGAGADLYISSMADSNADSYSNFPHSFESSAIPSTSGQKGDSSSTNTSSPGSGATSPSSASPTTPPSSDLNGDSSNSGNGKSVLEGWGCITKPGWMSCSLTPSYHFTIADYEVFVPSG